MGKARTIILATAVAGTLDILSAFVFAHMAGMGVRGVLAFVASGPFGDGPTPTTGWALVGLCVHYAIMLCMVTAYVAIAPKIPALFNRPLLAGLLYGLLLWGIMYWLVRPLRWPELPLPHTPRGIAQQLFSHLILVGIPIAWIAKRQAR